MEPTDRTFDTKVPRIHRTKQLGWAGSDPNGHRRVFLMGPKERAAQILVQPLETLVQALATDSDALRSLDSIRRGGCDPASVASKYIWRSGRAQQIVEELFRRAAGSPCERGNLAFSTIAIRGVWVNAPMDTGDPQELGHASRDQVIARRLCAIGAGRCSHAPNQNGREVVCGTRLKARDRGKSRYCEAHLVEKRVSGVSLREQTARNERAEVTKFLHRVGRGLAAIPARRDNRVPFSG